jgi:hypothetical protein
MSGQALTKLVSSYLADNKGWVSESDRINAIIAILDTKGTECEEYHACTETNENADSLCGSHSLVEHAISIIHKCG